MYQDQIRPLLAAHARLLVPVDQLADDSDLYAAGLTSLSTVNLMLALEEHFDVEFLDRMLGRKTFGSIRALSEAIAELRGDAPPAAAPAAGLQARGAA
jgi:acyl carrier protein